MEDFHKPLINFFTLLIFITLTIASVFLHQTDAAAQNLFTDDFSHTGTLIDPEWQTVSGRFFIPWTILCPKAPSQPGGHPWDPGLFFRVHPVEGPSYPPGGFRAKRRHHFRLSGR